MSQENPSGQFEPYKDRAFNIATELLMLSKSSESNLKVIFRSSEDGETPVGLVLAAMGSAEYLHAMMDVIDMVNANYDILNSAKFVSKENEETL